MTLDQYVSYFRATTSPPSDINFFGRIMKGRQESDFSVLSDIAWRRLTMVMWKDGLSSIIGKTGREMLLKVGYQEQYIDQKISEGYQFKLAVFPRFEGIYLATWPNVVLAVNQAYPGMSNFLAPHLPALVNTSFWQIEESSGYVFADVQQEGETHPFFMTYEKYMDSSKSLSETRAFFYFTLGLYELFRGDGFTQNAEGKRGMLEFIAPKAQLSGLPEYRLLDIKVEPRE